MTDSIRSDWIDETYDEKLGNFAASQGAPRGCVDQAFREHCETFQSTVIEGTTVEVVRQLAFHKLEWHPPKGAEPTPAEDGSAESAGG